MRVVLLEDSGLVAMACCLVACGLSFFPVDRWIYFSHCFGMLYFRGIFGALLPAFCVLVLTLSSGTAQTVFEVGRVPSERSPKEQLLELFTAAQSSYYIDGADALVSFPAVQPLKGIVYEKLGTKRVSVITLSGDVVELWLLAGESMYLTGGSTLKGSAIRRGGRSYYYSEEGQPERLREALMNEVGGQQLTQEWFVKYLKDGGEVEVGVGEECERCWGAGSVSVDIGVKDKCPVCRGAGVVEKRYRLLWQK